MSGSCPYKKRATEPALAEGSESKLPKQQRTDGLRRGGPAEPVYYASYLQLDKVLSAQRLLSAQDPEAQNGNGEGSPHSPSARPEGAHDEHLFIIIHQARTYL